MPVPPAGRLVAITNATIMTASHGTIQRGTVLIRDGRIAEVGTHAELLKHKGAYARLYQAQLEQAKRHLTI